MSQKTNLNISPYYDDFNDGNNFYRVLFKPGRPVQARELTTLQSILQNQVKSFGSHVFKEGSMVLPGGVNYDDRYYSVKLESEHLGLPISLYLSSLKGKKLKGQNSGIELLINDCKVPSDSLDITDTTIFVKYLTGNTNNEIADLDDGEPLITLEDITYGNTTISTGESVATLISTNASSVGSAVKMNEGVYFVRGTFVSVPTSTIILDPYSNTPSYRVGLNILESIISAKDDSSLYDNAKGFSNFAAPGADRLKITATLSKKALTDTSDVSFVELIKVREGELKKLQDFSVYNELEKYLAARTFEESGNYSLDNFEVKVSDSLDTGLSNGGIFKSNQVTEQGNTPSDDLGCVEISSGKAYVRGFRISQPGTTIIDFEKPRDKEKEKVALVPFDMGTTIRVNNVSGTPALGTNSSTPGNANSNVVSLLSRRKTSSKANAIPTGAYEIGKARVYSFGLRNTPYIDNSSQWSLHLFDVQTYTFITLNTSLTATISSFVRGASSGATGFINSSVTSASEIVLSQTSGTFIPNEKLIINESEESFRSIISVRQYTFEDVKSVYQDSLISGFNLDFSADTVLERTRISSLPESNTCIINGSTLVSPGNAFTGIKTDSIVQYQVAGNSDVTFNRVSSISSDLKTLTLSATTLVPDVNVGTIGVTSTTVALASPVVVDKENTGLYAKLGFDNICEVDLGNASLSLSAQTAKINLSQNATTQPIPAGISSAFFDNFDTQKYSLVYADGTVEPLTRDQFKLVDGSSKVEFSGLTVGAGNTAVLNVTLEKVGITEKTKQFVRSNKIVINKTKIGVSTSTNGLTFNQYYGLRIEDREISLNVPDVVNIVSVLESKDSNDPTLDTITTVSGLSLNTNTVVGEKIIGQESGAVAQLVTRVNAESVEIAYFTDTQFTLGELIRFDESNIETTVQAITLGNNTNVTEKYSLDKGQREQYYDYSRLVRKPTLNAPSRRLLVIFNTYEVPSTDTGDVFTVNSYDKDRFTSDVPILDNNLRVSDTLDFRPRVTSNVSASSSPFAFTSRDFSSSGATSSLVVSPEGSSRLGYSYFLPRIDKLILSRGKDYEGSFAVIKGISSLNPKPPELIDGAMHIATINLPAYLYNPDDAEIKLIDNRRYTMRDIGKLEDRIENLEILTSLSLLEVDTKTLQVKDVTGDRFKSGFFVDDFKDAGRLDLDNDDCRVSIDADNQQMIAPVDQFTVKPLIGVAESIDLNSADFSQNLLLLDSNLQKTGDLITLKYSEIKSDIGNPQASRVENINPYEVVVRRGRVLLNPSQDNWTRVEEIDGGVRTIFGDPRNTSTERILTSSRPDPFIRSRNVGFDAFSLTPGVRHYPYFEGRSGIDIIPKLLEISMVSGTFSIGETVVGINEQGDQLISFRVAQPNHKTGAYNSASTVFQSNPYDTTLSLGSFYTESAVVLNVDIASLCEDAQGQFSGRVRTNLRLIGQTSGAISTISNVRLIPDSFGSVYGSFFFREPNTTPPPPLRFRNGTKTFRLTSDVNNANPLRGDEGIGITRGDAQYVTFGIIDSFTSTLVRRVPPPRPPGDPLSQTFTVDETGMFLSSIDLFFATKDANVPVTVQLREVELGTPTNQVVSDFAEVSLDPTELDSSGESIIKTSADASLPTRVTFPSPVYLEPNREYAIVLLAPATIEYKMWIAQMGEETIETQTLGVDQGSKSIVTKQYLGGSLFKSQNGTIWTATQTQDLKFSLYKCSFVTTPGSLTMFNSDLTTNDKINSKLQDNSLKTYPRKLRVGVDTTTALSSTISVGTKVSASNVSPYTNSTDAKGFVEKIGGPINGDAGRSITGFGTGYSGGPYSNVNLYSITGDGTGATGNIQTSGGEIASVAIAATGNGYVVGDVLGITTAEVGNAGSGAEITVTGVFGMDTLYLTNVQGEKINNGRKLVYYTDVTSGTIANSTVDVRGDSIVNGSLYEGNVLEVNSSNHSMNSIQNVVQIDGVKPDTTPILLTENITSTDTTISVASTTPFATFEGISTSTGYVQVGREIIYYNGIGIGNLSVGQRGFGGSPKDSHFINDQAIKYEFNGISLTGINTTHNLPTSATLQSKKTSDSYLLEINRGAGRSNLQNRSIGINQISFADEKIGGENRIVGTQNFQYDAFIPSFNVTTPSPATVVSSQLRSVSGTSDGGNEISFVDQGYESVEFNQINRLPSPRLLSSKPNEDVKLSGLPRSKSVTLLTRFSTTDSNLSPVLDTMNGAFRFLRNRLNKPILDYATDSRSNAISNDPHSACYISQKVNLKQASTSLKVLVSAYRHESADFRALYRLFKTDSSEVDQSYELFPGFNNLKNVGIDKIVVDPKLNDGRPDVPVPPNKEGEFSEYEFTIDNLDEFVGFQIKIVSSGTNEAYPPIFKDLRVIALA